MAGIHPPDMLEVVVSKRGRSRTISLKGELDIATAPDLEELLTKSRKDGLDALKVDLRGLDFIDSNGLRVLVEAWKSCFKEGVTFTLAPGPRQVQRVFDVAGLLDQLPWS